eukprot:4575912-Alexandrium_andersonii.AAC.1
MLNGAQPPNAHPPARGSSSVEAPSKVRVHIHAEADPIVLPREVVDTPRAHGQTSRQPDQRRPVCGGE